jgi:uncharacterized protein (TIGR02611 family)
MDTPSPVLIRIVRITTGVVLVIAGIAMLVLPGPGVLTIVGGFALLAKDFRWAQHIVDWIHDQWDEAKAYAAKRKEDHLESAAEKPQTDAA